MTHIQKELFSTDILEIKPGTFYGKYAVWEEGVCRAEFFDLELAGKFIRVRLAAHGFRGSEIFDIENKVLKNYRKQEDKIWETV